MREQVYQSQDTFGVTYIDLLYGISLCAIKHSAWILGDELYPTIVSEEQYKLAQAKRREHIGRNGKTKKANSLENES